MVFTSTRVYNRSESCNVVYERCRAVSRRKLTGKGNFRGGLSAARLSTGPTS